MTMFCSTKMIDYLIDNYIVWPWDITLESNRNTYVYIGNLIRNNFSFFVYSKSEYTIESVSLSARPFTR